MHSIRTTLGLLLHFFKPRCFVFDHCKTRQSITCVRNSDRPNKARVQDHMSQETATRTGQRGPCQSYLSSKCPSLLAVDGSIRNFIILCPCPSPNPWQAPRRPVSNFVRLSCLLSMSVCAVRYFLSLINLFHLSLYIYIYGFLMIKNVN